MGELAERAIEVVADTANGIVSQAAAGLLATAGVALHKPELIAAAVPGGAFAGAMSAQGVALAYRSWKDPSDRADHFAETASEEAGVPIDELMRLAKENERLRELLARSVASATTSFDTDKVEMLARAFALGAKDPAAIDDMLALVELVRNVDGRHVRALAALKKAEEAGRAWLDVHQFVKYDDALGVNVAPLLKALIDEGLIVSRGANRFEASLTDTGLFLAESLKRIGNDSLAKNP